MGWLKLLFNATNSDGTREAMRLSYRKARQQTANQGRESSHIAGLYSALASRNLGRGIPAPEPAVWGELSPFLLMSESVSVEALSEYIVYRERPWDANTAWLKREINTAFRSAPESDESRFGLAFAGIANKASWLDLLEDDVKSTFTKEMERRFHSK